MGGGGRAFRFHHGKLRTEAARDKPEWGLGGLFNSGDTYAMCFPKRYPSSQMRLLSAKLAY
jgi:hypothetical protein